MGQFNESTGAIPSLRKQRFDFDSQLSNPCVDSIRVGQPSATNLYTRLLNQSLGRIYVWQLPTKILLLDG